MKRKSILSTLAVAAASIPMLMLAEEPVKAKDPVKKPNIIFIFADDWGYGDLGVHNSTFCKTPHLDKMASEGTNFQDFTVNSPVCSPSRTAVMTGHFPARHSVHQHFSTLKHHMRAGMPDWLDPDTTMLPRLMQEAGYVTAHFGKWHLSNVEVTDAPLPPAYGYDAYGAFNLPSNAPEQMPAAASCPRAVEFIRENADKPFFINLWLHETHTPHYPLDEYLAKFEDLDERQKVYAAIIAEGDAGVGLVLDTLKELKLDDNTLVIFSSDNGPENTSKKDTKTMNDNSTGPGLSTYYSVGETGGLKGRKRFVYAGGIRVPFIVRWPGVVPAGKVNRESILTAVDLLPTFVSLAGGKLPEGYVSDGEDFSAVIKGQSFDRQKPIFYEFSPMNFPNVAVRDGEWKLVADKKLSKVELYNIEKDWAETTDRSKEFPELVNKMKNQISEWRATIPKEAPSHCFSKERASLETKK